MLPEIFGHKMNEYQKWAIELRRIKGAESFELELVGIAGRKLIDPCTPGCKVLFDIRWYGSYIVTDGDSWWICRREPGTKPHYQSTGRRICKATSVEREDTRLPSRKQIRKAIAALGKEEVN